MDNEELIFSDDSITRNDNTGKFCALCGNFVPSYKTECDVCHGVDFVDSYDEYKQRKEAELARLAQMRDDVAVAEQALRSEETAARQKAEADALEKLRLKKEILKQQNEQAERAARERQAREKKKQQKTAERKSRRKDDDAISRCLHLLGRGVKKVIDFIENHQNFLKVVGIMLIAIGVIVLVISVLI